MKSKFYNGIVNTLGPVVRVLFRIHHHGKQNEPDESEGPYILVCNHISNADPVFLCAGIKNQQPHYMAKKSLFKLPLLNKLFEALGAYPVNRGGIDVSAIKNSINMLKTGRCVGIFPQGTREKGKTPMEADLKNGAAMIVTKANATIFPCCIKTKGNKFAFFRRVDVYYGKPIKFEELDYNSENSGEYTRITNLMFERVCELYKNAEAEEEAKRASRGK
jgi:1-acyl-sn-glycerol-3-phosphate acyltransferase